MKLIFALLMSIAVAHASYESSRADSEGVVGKIKSHRIEGLLTPLTIYEVCLDKIVYFVLIKGYKAGLSPKIKDVNGTIGAYKCKFKDGRWMEE